MVGSTCDVVDKMLQEAHKFYRLRTQQGPVAASTHLSSLALYITYSGYWNLSVFNLFLHGISCTRFCVLCALGLSDTIIAIRCFYFFN